MADDHDVKIHIGTSADTAPIEKSSHAIKELFHSARALRHELPGIGHASHLLRAALHPIGAAAIVAGLGIAKLLEAMKAASEAAKKLSEDYYNATDTFAKKAGESARSGAAFETHLKNLKAAVEPSRIALDSLNKAIAQYYEYQTKGIDAIAKQEKAKLAERERRGEPKHLVIQEEAQIERAAMIRHEAALQQKEDAELALEKDKAANEARIEQANHEKAVALKAQEDKSKLITDNAKKIEELKKEAIESDKKVTAATGKFTFLSTGEPSSGGVKGFLQAASRGAGIQHAPEDIEKAKRELDEAEEDRGRIKTQLDGELRFREKHLSNLQALETKRKEAESKAEEALKKRQEHEKNIGEMGATIPTSRDQRAKLLGIDLRTLGIETYTKVMKELAEEVKKLTDERLKKAKEANENLGKPKPPSITVPPVVIPVQQLTPAQLAEINAAFKQIGIDMKTNMIQGFRSGFNNGLNP